jgi:clan AA aspartic protease (TIGR02281 family)
MNASGDRALHHLLVSRGYSPVELTRTKVGHFSIAGTIGGRSVVFLLDTGASRTVIDRGTAASLGLEPRFVDNLGGGLGATSARTDSAPVANVTLDGFQTHLDGVFVMDLDTVNQALVANGSEPVDGVVGADVLLHSGAIIDYGRGVLYLQNPLYP